MIPTSLPKQIDDIKLECEVEFDNIGRKIYGCCVLTDGRAAFTNLRSKSIRVRDIYGSEKFLNCRECSMDIAVIDDDTIAVSNESRGGIDIINIKAEYFNTILPYLTRISGLKYIKGHIIFCHPLGIQMVNLRSQTITNIVEVKLLGNSYVTSHDDKIYVTNDLVNTVTSYDMKGKMLWEFKDKSKLIDPKGITIDNDGYIYVVGSGTKNVVVISSDGQRCKEILKASRGDLTTESFKVWSLYHDKINKKLLVGSYNCIALLFNVK